MTTRRPVLTSSRFRKVSRTALLPRPFTTTSKPANMDADQFRKAAHAAIEESKFSIRCLTSSPTPRSHRIQPKHHLLPCSATDQARLPRSSTTVFRTLRAAAMVQDPARHRFQDHPWPHALAVSQIHGLLPCWRHLPFYAWRNVLSRLQRTCLQLALLTSLH